LRLPIVFQVCGVWLRSHGGKSFATSASEVGVADLPAFGGASTAVLLFRKLDGKLLHLHQVRPRVSSVYLIPGVTEQSVLQA
jgi:hypothetical protein